MKNFTIRQFLKGFSILAIVWVPSMIKAIKLATNSSAVLTQLIYITVATTIVFIGSIFSISIGKAIERIRLLLILISIARIVRKLLDEALIANDYELINELIYAHETANSIDLRNYAMYKDNLFILKTIKELLIVEKITLFENKVK